MDPQLLISDYTKHGAEQILGCGSRELAAGNQDVSVEGYTSDFALAATFFATYAGPDAGGGEVEHFMPSTENLSKVPVCPAPNPDGFNQCILQHQFFS
jgi:hypothetical protein